jgi:hypothetical protein
VTRCDARRAGGKGRPNKHHTRLVRAGGARVASQQSAMHENADVVGRWHDNRHTLVTELAESGTGDEVIMSITGHVSRAMLSRYSHVRMEAKRRALDEIAARQGAADGKRKEAAERQQQAAEYYLQSDHHLRDGSAAFGRSSCGRTEAAGVVAGSALAALGVRSN